MVETCGYRTVVRVAAKVCALVAFCVAITPVATAWDGELDTGFGGDGIMAIQMGTGDGEARGVAVRADGTYVLVGVAENTNDDFAFAAAVAKPAARTSVSAMVAARKRITSSPARSFP